MSEPRRRRPDTTTVLSVALAVALVAGYALAVYLSQELYFVDAPPGSTFSAAPGGLKTTFRYLRELGADVRTLQQFEELPAGGTIVVAAPEGLIVEPSEYEADRLAEWVEGGGRLVFAGADVGLLAGGFGFDLARLTQEEATLSPVQPTVYARGVREISAGDVRLLADDSGWAVTFKDSTGQVLLSRAVGSGEVAWLSDAAPLTNERLGRADNGAFAVRLLASRPGPVWFDEYHHGFAKGGGVWDRLGGGGRSAMVLLLLALFALTVARSQRLGPAIDVPEVPKARTSAYIDSLAELYRKAGARAHALEVLEDGLVRAVARRHGTAAAGLARHPEAAAAVEGSRALRAGRTMTVQEFLGAASELRRVRCEVEGR